MLRWLLNVVLRLENVLNVWIGCCFSLFSDFTHINQFDDQQKRRRGPQYGHLSPVTSRSSKGSKQFAARFEVTELSLPMRSRFRTLKRVTNWRKLVHPSTPLRASALLPNASSAAHTHTSGHIRLSFARAFDEESPGPSWAIIDMSCANHDPCLSARRVDHRTGDVCACLWATPQGRSWRTA